MSELDVLLRESLGRLAEPGDPTGVADAIRLRVDSAGSPGGGSMGGGGAGTPVTRGGSSGAAGAEGTAAGGGGAGSGFWGGWAPFGILIGLSVAGGAALAVATQQAADGGATPLAPLSLAASNGIPASACPGGHAVTALDPGARLLALSQSEDGAYFSVRDPHALGTVVWVAKGVAVVDLGQDPDALPVSGCYEAGEVVPIVTQGPAEPETAPQPEPQPGPRPAPGGGGSTPPPVTTDSVKPTIQVGNWSESYTCTVDVGYGPASASISITVGDNVGVTSVTASSPTPGVSLSGPSGSGATRTFTVSRSGNTDATIQVTFTVKDAAGNTVTGSAPGLDSLGGGSCLI